MKDKEIGIMCKKIIKILEGRLETLEMYRDMDIGKEILDTLNEIKKYKDMLRKHEGSKN